MGACAGNVLGIAPPLFPTYHAQGMVLKVPLKTLLGIKSFSEAKVEKIRCVECVCVHVCARTFGECVCALWVRDGRADDDDSQRRWPATRMGALLRVW